MRSALVTGGSGFFGETLVQRLLARGYRVRILDLNPPSSFARPIDFVQADICDKAAVRAACAGIDIVHHNVAQVPLARDKTLFWRVNRDGTDTLLRAAAEAGVSKVVYTSSSAVFGVPERNPVTRDTPPAPAEDYGRAKLAGEQSCRTANAAGLDVSIIRPRTILGPTRMGIFEILYDWTARGLDLPVLDGGRNTYQFVHAEDLADACIAAGERPGFAVYNIGADRFGTMRELLESLATHAGTGSRVKSVPMGPIVALMRLAGHIGVSPLGPYHALMYGRSLWFDIEPAVQQLGFRPRYSSVEALCEGYDWYCANRDLITRSGRSLHQSTTKRGILTFFPYVLRALPQ